MITSEANNFTLLNAEKVTDVTSKKAPAKKNSITCENI